MVLVAIASEPAGKSSSSPPTMCGRQRWMGSIHGVGRAAEVLVVYNETRDHILFRKQAKYHKQTQLQYRSFLLPNLNILTYINRTFKGFLQRMRVDLVVIIYSFSSYSSMFFAGTKGNNRTIEPR